MTKITSPADLTAIRDRARAEIDLRTGPKEMRITVHMSTCGIAAGARDILQALITALGAVEADNVSLQQSACMGLCDQEPMISLTDKDGNVYRYGRLNKHKVGQIVREHVVRGNPVGEFLLKA